MLWDDGTQNVVSSKELKTEKYKRFKVGNRVKMKWNRKWYYGTVLDKERVPSCVDSSDDDVPLIKIAEKLRNQVSLMLCY